MLIRWIGAYGKGDSLEDALRWEITQRDREVAAEYVFRATVSEWRGGFGYEHIAPVVRGQGFIDHALVGMWLDKRAWIKGYPGDVWSRTDEAGRLYATRRAVVRSHGHTEIFCKPGYVKALILKRHPSTLGPAILKTLKTISVEYDLPVFYLNKKGRRTLVTDEVRRYRGRA